jgi:hypothetical protein
MKKGDFVKVKGDSHVYEIHNVEENIATVVDGHKKKYTVELNLLVKL